MGRRGGGAGGKGGGRGRGGGWDQVPIGEEFLRKEEMEALISLEVLNDYSLTKTKEGLTEIIPAGGSRKRPRSSSPDNKKKATEEAGGSGGWVVTPIPQWEEEEEEEKPKPNKKRKKKEKKKKERAPPPPKEEPDEEEEEEGEEGGVTAEWSRLGVVEPALLKGLSHLGFSTPTEIQLLTLPAALMGAQDVVGAAETGSGKTLCFGLPILQGLLRGRGEGEGRLQALVLTPTRELALQIKKHFDLLSKFTGLQSVVLVGGLAAQKQERLLRKKPEIVIATPGRLFELVQEGNQHLSALSKIRYLAIDETDRMLERGHFQELASILTLINAKEEEGEAADAEGDSSPPTTPHHPRQNFLFSATLAFTHEPPKRLFNQHGKGKKKAAVTKPSGEEKLREIMALVGIREGRRKIVDVTGAKGTAASLSEMQINCPANKKDSYLYYFLLLQAGRTLVFCNSINTVRRLVNLFFFLKMEKPVLPLHAEMNQKMRLRNLERFAESDDAVVIATDVAARGLDIKDVKHVVHYEIPKTAESYIHRSGRTARALKDGVAVVLVEPAEIARLKNIFRSLNRDPEKMLPLFPVDGAVLKRLRTRIDEADKVEKFEHTVRKKLADLNWMDKARKEMDLEVSEEEGQEEDEGDAESRRRKNLLQAKKKLDGYKKALSKLLEDNSFLSQLNANKGKL